MSPVTGRAVVVGASLAGVTAAAALRQRGFDGSVTLLGEEPYQAYARPALSKGVLAGAETAESVLLPAASADVEVRTGSRAVRLDLGARQVELRGGERVPFDLLVIATGARARSLGHSPHEIVLRTLDDALALRDRLGSARRMLVVGGGFLGMEIASVARDLGLSVTAVDVREPLVAALGPWLARRLTNAARERGIRIVVSPEGVERLDSHAVRLGDGTLLEADLIVTAIGDEPNVEWLGGAGVGLASGVVVDSRCRVDRCVAAAGDVTVFPGADGLPRRMPHWDNALGQARVAAEALLLGDAAAPYRPDPYYWTEAFGLAVKIAGPLPVTGPPVVLEGSLDAGSALVRWEGRRRPTVAAINHRVSVGRLRRMAAEPSAADDARSAASLPLS